MRHTNSSTTFFRWQILFAHKTLHDYYNTIRNCLHDVEYLFLTAGRIATPFQTLFIYNSSQMLQVPPDRCKLPCLKTCLPPYACFIMILFQVGMQFLTAIIDEEHLYNVFQDQKELLPNLVQLSLVSRDLLPLISETTERTRETCEMKMTSQKKSNFCKLAPFAITFENKVFCSFVLQPEILAYNCSFYTDTQPR